MTPLPAGLDALAAGGKPALARCLSALEGDPDDPRLVPLLEAAWRTPCGIALGLTGPPGVGKSTLTGALVRRLRARGDTVAVIAVDPSSRASGGALLGDRLRIATDPGDPGVFVRSMAARDRLGGLAEAAFPAVVLMRARFDWVLVETVGVGQSETEIADCADLVALCVQPGSGDAVQFMKAGVMEVPDLVLVTKGDLGAPARRTEAELRRALALAPGGASPAVAVVSALEGGGVATVLDLLGARRHATSDLGPRREAQGRAWIRARLIESFGRVGAAALAPLLADRDGPFEPLATLSQRAREALYECLKRV